MADYYIDHNNTTLYPSAYMATPTGPSQLPQEGDGRASGTGATPTYASASWDLTSASASSGTMTIMGASVTGLNGSGATLASAIATAINASTASAATVTTGNVTTPYLKAVVWAQASGATLNVYTRIASDRLNYANNTACAMAAGTGWTSPPSTAQFSGGVSGPWRYFANTTALAAAVSGGNTGDVTLYGGFVATVMTSTAADDTIHVRTKRGGSNIEARYITSGYCDVKSSRFGTWLFDAGNVWSGDDGVFKLTVSSTHGGVSIAFTVNDGKVDGNGQRLWVVYQDVANPFLGAMCVGIGSVGNTQTYEGIKYEIHASAGGTVGFNGFGNTGSSVIYRGCKFVVSRLNSYPGLMFGIGTGINAYASMTMENCDIEFTGLLSAPSSKIFRLSRESYLTAVILRDVRVYDANNSATKFPLLQYVNSSGSNTIVCYARCENVSGVNVTLADFSTGLVGSVAPDRGHREQAYSHTLITSKDQGAYRLETLRGYSDWIPGQGYPTLSALLPDGTAWSIRSLWYGQYLGPLWEPYKVQSDQLYTGSNAVKTITAELLFDGDIADADIHREAIVMVVSYTASDGSAKSESTLPTRPAKTTQLATGSNAWAGLTGGYAAFKPRKLTLTTASAVKANTNIQVVIEFRLACPTAVSGKNVFFDPEFGIA